MLRVCLRGICMLLAVGVINHLAGEYLCAQNDPNVGLGFANVRQVGGVTVDTEGVLRNVDPAERKELAGLLSKALKEVPLGFQGTTELRMISLRKLQDLIAEKVAQQQPIPQEAVLMGGLQRVQYLFIDEANKDIILAGPAEAWKTDALGNIVGVTTNQPVLLLEDFVAALRAIDNARNGGITCSIDPTPAAVQAAQDYLGQLPKGIKAGQVSAELEKRMGLQVVSVTGVQADSHFAQVLVAADYRMKRLGMNFDKSGIKGFPSYLEMAGAKENMFPRWWLAPNYEPLGKSADGLAWEIRGTGVKCLTADDHFNASGERVETQAAGGSAKKWADLMTSKYEELCQKEPVFAQLRTCMDLAVVSALIQQQRLTDRLELSFATFLDDNTLPLASYNVPKNVPTIGSAVKKGSTWVISASGGVAFQPWEAVQKSTDDPAAAKAKETALAQRGDNWWWNAKK
ncbi:MAG: DUF1598 domain-containing protein [Pirellulales bacterium]|nr:DUF1598 domain-containing protein [Pirellulales bacterium]